MNGRDNIRIMEPAGTLMFGRSMLNQFGYELELLGVKNPVMITIDAYRKKARRAAARMNLYNPEIEVLSRTDAGSDFLLLAGGKALIDRWADDPRPKAWVMLEQEDLADFTEPCTDFIIADTAFLKKDENAELFLRNYAFSVSDGLACSPVPVSIPDAFVYSRRTKVWAGDRALEQLPLILSDGKSEKPLVLTDKGIKAAGVFDILADMLKGIDFEVYDDIPPDSGSRIVNEISRLYKEKGCRGIVALGGGSVLDTGKGVFLNVSLGEEDLGVLAGSNRIPLLDTPFIAVPTTSGTGSEVTKVAVISDSGRHRKILYVSPYLMPGAAILDSRMTASLPAHLSSITGMDALSHAVEAYTCLGRNPVSDQMAWSAIELIRDNLIPAVKEPENISLRLNLALASNLAGQAFSNSMVGMIHTIGHSVGAVCHAPHGSCMSVLMPAALEYNYPEIRPLLAELLPALAGPGVAESVAPEKRASESIETVRRMNRELKELSGGRHPTRLSEIKGRDGKPLVLPVHFDLIAETSLGDASIVYNPVELRVNNIKKLLEDCY